jgi:predicted CopG family antitoxin
MILIGTKQMHKKLTITLDEGVYRSLYRKVGKGHISQFIENLIRPQLLTIDLNAGYSQMAQDTAREAEAIEWAEAVIGDITDEPR